MAGPELTFDDVATTARRLLQDGKPVTVGSVREAFGATADLAPSTSSIHEHLSAWRAGQAQPSDDAGAQVSVPESIMAAMDAWARQLKEEAAAPLRDRLAQTTADLASLLQLNERAETERDSVSAQLSQLTADHERSLANLAERDASIERLTIELRHARSIASDALVGKAKDQLAIEGKDGQLAELRRQLERQVAMTATESDARLAAEMELVGAVTARDNFSAELVEMRAELDARRAAV